MFFSQAFLWFHAYLDLHSEKKPFILAEESHNMFNTYSSMTSQTHSEFIHHFLFSTFQCFFHKCFTSPALTQVLLVNDFNIFIVILALKILYFKLKLKMMVQTDKGSEDVVIGAGLLMETN